MPNSSNRHAERTRMVVEALAMVGFTLCVTAMLFWLGP
jgi:hypothetical protein